MDPINQQVGSRTKEATISPVQGERGSTADQPSTRGWTATNQPADQGAGQVRTVPGHAHARSLSIDRGITAGPGVLDTGQQQTMGLQPSLHRQNSSQLPSFKSLISSVDDPNEKDPIPPITYSHNAAIESNPHPAASSSSPIRKQHICHSCKKTFPSKNSLSKHKQIHGERSHICLECSSKFHTKKDLTRHRDTVHASNSPNYVCPVLECARSNPKRAFSRRDNLRQHILQLHDKKYLEEIRNPQAFSPSHMQTDNTSRSPEGGSSPRSDDLPPHTIDEVVEEHQPERIEVRTPIQLVIGEDEAFEEEELMVAGDKGKGRSTEYASSPERLSMPANRPHSPLESPRDVVMSTPKFLVQDYDPVPEQEPLEARNASVHQHSPIRSEEDRPVQTEDELDETWVINFLEGIEATELDQVAQLSPDGLKRKYPNITTQRRLNLIKFALRGFVAGFSRGYQCGHAHAKISAVFSAPQPAPLVSSRTSLSVISPSHMPDGKASLSPLTPTSLAATSPTNRLGNDSGPTGIFGSAQQQTKEPPTFRGESSNSFVVPHLPRTNTAAQEVKPITNPNKAEDTTRPPPQSVATDADTVPEFHPCNYEKCGKTFTKKSEWKKHMQRHRRPFFCTFHWQERGEVQRFGSKDDWRRHEEHRHYQSEFYKCPGGSGDKSCLSDFSGRIEFEKHLEEHHKPIIASWTLPDGKINDDVKRNFLQQYHNGTDYIEDNFWCGFCAKLIAIPPEMTGRRGKEIRVNHVADHFHKEQKDIRLWVKYNECDLNDIPQSLENARKRYDRELNLRESDLEVLDQQRQLPPIKEIFGSSTEHFPANASGPSAVPPEFWICCECQYLAQNRPSFVYVMNLGKDMECSSDEHRHHRRCPRCSVARSQY